MYRGYSPRAAGCKFNSQLVNPLPHVFPVLSLCPLPVSLHFEMKATSAKKSLKKKKKKKKMNAYTVALTKEIGKKKKYFMEVLLLPQEKLRR